MIRALGLCLLLCGCAPVAAEQVISLRDSFCLGTEHLRCSPTEEQLTTLYPYPDAALIHRGYAPHSHPGMPSFLSEFCTAPLELPSCSSLEEARSPKLSLSAQRDQQHDAEAFFTDWTWQQGIAYALLLLLILIGACVWVSLQPMIEAWWQQRRKK